MESARLTLSKPPELTRAILDKEYEFAREFRKDHDGLLPDTPFWSFAENKYELHPVRFTHFHEGITPWIREDLFLRAKHGDPGCACGNHTISTPSGGPQCVDQPSSFGMFIVGVCVLASALWFCRREG